MALNILNKQKCADLWASRVEWTEYDVYIMARNDYQLFRYNPQDGILGSFFSFAGFLCLFEFIIWLMIL